MKSFQNPKIGGLLYGSPLKVDATYSASIGSPGIQSEGYNFTTTYSHNLNAKNILAETIFESNLNLGDMLKGLDVSSLNTSFVDTLKKISYSGKQVYENGTILDDHEAAH